MRNIPLLIIRLPAPPGHFRNQHVKHCDPVPPLFIRLPSPQRKFWTDTPSAVSQSHHSSSDSSFINNSSGMKQIFSASYHLSSAAFFTSCWEIPISKDYLRFWWESPIGHSVEVIGKCSKEPHLHQFFLSVDFHGWLFMVSYFASSMLMRLVWNCIHGL